MSIAVIFIIYSMTFVWGNAKIQSQSKVLASVGISFIMFLIMMLS